MRDEEEGLVGPSHPQGRNGDRVSAASSSAHAAAAAADSRAVQLRHMPDRKADCFDYFCWFLNITTAVVALLCVVANGMAIALYVPAKDLPSVLEQALRVYAVLGALLIALVETEWERIFQLFRFAQAWIGRALMQIFVALLTFKIATAEGRSCSDIDPPDRSCDFNKSLELYRFASAMALLGCGSFYFVGGILCFGYVRRARVRQQQERHQAETDLAELEEEVERKREALQRLLVRRE